MHVVELLCRVASRGDKDASWTREAVENGIVELVVALEVFEASLAEIDDARAANALSIVKDVFEAERIDGIVVFLVVGRVDELFVVGRGVGNQAEVALIGHAPIRAVVAAACSNACRMGSMGLDESVVAMAEGKELFLSGVFAPHVEWTADGVGGNLVPQPTDAVVRARGVVEGGMREVEADIHHSHYHSIARIGLRQGRSSIDGHRVDMHGGGVHQRMGATSSLDALDASVEGERGETADRDVGDVNVAKTCQAAATVSLEHITAVGREPDECTHMPLSLAQAALQPRFNGMGLLPVDQHQAQTGRQLGIVGLLGFYGAYAQKQKRLKKP